MKIEEFTTKILPLKNNLLRVAFRITGNTEEAEDVVQEGFADVEMPGRFEVMGVQPLTIIDSAHNPPGADVCAEVFFGDFNPDGRRILVVGTPREPGAMLAALRADEFDVA